MFVLLILNQSLLLRLESCFFSVDVKLTASAAIFLTTPLLPLICYEGMIRKKKMPCLLRSILFQLDIHQHNEICHLDITLKILILFLVLLKKQKNKINKTFHGSVERFVLRKNLVCTSCHLPLHNQM